jgi:hypothetical protein
LTAGEKKFSESLPSHRGLAGLDVIVRRLHRDKAHHSQRTLHSLVGGPSKLYEDSRAQIQGAIGALVKRAIKNGDIRKDLEPFDLRRALIGVSSVASGPAWQ